jgi:hypothetical protein
MKVLLFGENEDVLSVKEIVGFENLILIIGILFQHEFKHNKMLFHLYTIKKKKDEK